MKDTTETNKISEAFEELAPKPTRPSMEELRRENKRLLEEAERVRLEEANRRLREFILSGGRSSWL